jgi:anti-sigma B factor antagonist
MALDLTDLQASSAALNARVPSIRVSVGISSSPGALVITVAGSLDTGTSPAVLDFVKAALSEAEDAGGLILDIGAIQYISSTGIGAFTTLLVETQNRELPFFLCRTPACVNSVLQVLGFLSFFEYLETFEEKK